MAYVCHTFCGKLLKSGKNFRIKFGKVHIGFLFGAVVFNKLFTKVKILCIDGFCADFLCNFKTPINNINNGYILYAACNKTRGR